jgi:hypothetical protein
MTKSTEQRSISEDTEFLFSVLRESTRALPVFISINVFGKGYIIRDGSGIVIWGDDFPVGGGAEIIKAISRLFVLEDRPLLIVNDETDKRESLDLTLCNKYVKRARMLHGGSVSIRMHFVSATGNKIYEIMIDKLKQF